MKSFKIALLMNKKLFCILAIFGALLLLLRMVSGPSSAKFSEERVIDNLVPKHVPIKIKIKEDKERALKDMNNDRWTSDLELEVTNTSDKPIYLLELWVEMPEIISENGHRVGFTLRYGRAAFVDFDAHPIPDDKPIEPKETYVFKIEEKYQQSWAAYKAKNHKADPKRIEITFTQLSFGDGSGFNGSDAKPYPYVREKASTGPCRNIPETIDNSFSTSSVLISSFRNSLTESLSFQKSAEFKPASFFWSEQRDFCQCRQEKVAKIVPYGPPYKFNNYRSSLPFNLEHD